MKPPLVVVQLGRHYDHLVMMCLSGLFLCVDTAYAEPALVMPLDIEVWMPQRIVGPPSFG